MPLHARSCRQPVHQPRALPSPPARVEEARPALPPPVSAGAVIVAHATSTWIPLDRPPRVAAARRPRPRGRPARVGERAQQHARSAKSRLCAPRLAAIHAWFEDRDLRERAGAAQTSERRCARSLSSPLLHLLDARTVLTSCISVTGTRPPSSAISSPSPPPHLALTAPVGASPAPALPARRPSRRKHARDAARGLRRRVLGSD